MSTAPYFSQSGDILSEGYPGTTLKALVAALVPMDAALSIHSVLTDTASSYSVYIRIYDTPVYIKIYNSGTYAYIAIGYFDSSGTFVANQSYGQQYILTSDTSVCCFSWGLGDAIRFVGISSSYSSGVAIGFAYSKITANANKDSTVFALAFAQSGMGFPVAPIANISSGYIYNNDANILESVSISAGAPGNASLKSGYDYTLQPAFYNAASPTKGYVNIRWGGSYRLYRLYNNNSVVTITPGKAVSINGVSTMAVGMVLHAE